MNKPQPGGEISLQEFEKMRKAYDEKSPDKTKSVLFGKEYIEKLINKESTTGVRIYFGLNDDGALTVMLRPESDSASKAADDEPIIDKGQLCPPYCP